MAGISKRRNLRRGYTTGTCAAAAARGALLALLGREAADIEIELPAGGQARFTPRDRGRSESGGWCEIVKDAGDDPDITHGAVIRADVVVNAAGSVRIKGGDGVGTVTRPGLAVASGEPAINPVPRAMIECALVSLLPAGAGAEVTISVPGGRELARKTLNSRLGIHGGISILGTTGIVEPYSHSAYRESLVCAFDVLQAAGGRIAVLSTGKGSEAVARQVFCELPDAAFVLMADYFSFALGSSRRRGLLELHVACYPAKLTKMAAGAACTHCSSSTVDVDVFARAAGAAGMSPGECAGIVRANTIRHACEMLSASQQHEVCRYLAGLLVERIKRETGGGITAGALVVSYGNRVLAQVRQ